MAVVRDPTHECIRCGADAVMEMQPVFGDSTEPVGHVPVRWCSRDPAHRHVIPRRPQG